VARDSQARTRRAPNSGAVAASRPPGRNEPKRREAATASARPIAERPRNRRLPKRIEKPKGPSLSERLTVWKAAAHVRLEAHRGALRWLGHGTLVLGVLALAVFAGLALERYLKTSPAFAIDTINIEGMARMERGELLEAAGVDVGTNIFAKSPDEIRRDLLNHEWVASAEVTRRLPARIAISVVERTPVALLVIDSCAGTTDESADCDDGSSLHLVSDDGKVFKRHDAADPVDLPVITGVDRERYGSEPEFARELLMSAVSLIHAYQADDLAKRFPLGEIHIEEGQAFSLYVGAELTLVRLGISPFGAKLRRMKKVFEQLERESARAEYVYLDNEERPDRVAVRLR
jgi:cell division protein FtsQ